MKSLVELLDKGAYSCVISSGERIETFTQRGVADLHHLLHNEADFLRGALLADKIIGKGAAALIAKAQIARVYTHVISQGAYDLLRQEGIEFEFGTKVPYIINRAGTGQCPVEELCGESMDVDTIIEIIEQFILSKK